MAVTRAPQEPTFVFEEVVFSTVDIERGQFVQISRQEPEAPLMLPSQLTVVNPSRQVASGKQIKG